MDIIKEKEQPKLDLLQGGKGGPGYNWLGDMEVGTTFSARDKHSRDTTFLSQQFEVIHIHPRTVILASCLNEPKQYIEVLPLQFSIRFEWIQTIFDPKTVQDASTGSE